MTVTVQEAIAEVIKSLGEVTGSSVQTYAEPRIQQAVTKTFSFLKNKYYWPDYMQWNEHTLDGTLGIITDNAFTTLDNFLDIRAVYHEDRPTQAIPVLGTGVIPFKITGETPIYIDSLLYSDPNYVDRRIQFWPKASTGTVYTHARFMPKPRLNDTIYLDCDLIVEGATWMILNDEDINPEGTAKYEKLFNQRFQDIMKAYANQAIETPYRQEGNWPNDWTEAPWTW